MHGIGPWIGASKMSEVDFPKWICHNQSQARKGWLKKHAGTVEGPNIRGGPL